MIVNREKCGSVERLEEHFSCLPGSLVYVNALTHGPCNPETLRVYWSGDSALDALLPPNDLAGIDTAPFYAACHIRSWCIELVLNQMLTEPGRIVVVYEWTPPQWSTAQVLIRLEDGTKMWVPMRDIRDAILRGP